MACDRHRRQSGRRNDVRRDVLGVRWSALLPVFCADPDSPGIRGASARIVLFPCRIGIADRAQARNVGLRTVGRLVFIEVVLGTKYSVSLVVIALFRYRRWMPGVTLLAALAVGVVYNFCLLFFYY